MVDYNDVTDNVTFTPIWINRSVGGIGIEGIVNGSDDNKTWQAGSEVDVVVPALVGTVLTVVVLCTVVGNVMVLLAVFVNSHLRSTTNYFIVNLAIADLLLGTTVLPFSASLEVFKVSSKPQVCVRACVRACVCVCVCVLNSCLSSLSALYSFNDFVTHVLL